MGRGIYEGRDCRGTLVFTQIAKGIAFNGWGVGGGGEGGGGGGANTST